MFPVANRMNIVYPLAKQNMFSFGINTQSSCIICTYLEIHLFVSESYQKRHKSDEKVRKEIQCMLFNIQIL